MKVAVIGAGAWGTAVAIHAARLGPVLLYARDRTQADELEKARRNERYLPGVSFPESLRIGKSVAECVAHAGDAGLIVVASPVAGLRLSFTNLASVAASARKPQGPDFSPIIWLSKGLEAGTGLLPHQVAEQALPDNWPRGVLSGPSFAQEVAAGLPAALVVAGTHPVVGQRAEQAFHHDRMRIYFSADLIGVELGGAMKNVVAIAAGICDGLQLGANARAALMTRGLAELSRLGAAMGARGETFMGLAGMGDLVLTCATDLSRNRRVGLGLAAGQTLAEVVQSLGHVAEGVPCAAEAVRRAAELKVDMPIAQAVNDVICGKLTPLAAVNDLLAREAIAE
ncbi:MAG: NAD(P)H-dependent glycerol-3-phosphate dehydrogenase [Burkholderiaceae bacterium]